MPFPDAVLADPGHLADLRDAVRFLFHYLDLHEVWFAGDNSLPPYFQRLDKSGQDYGVQVDFGLDLKVKRCSEGPGCLGCGTMPGVARQS